MSSDAVLESIKLPEHQANRDAEHPAYKFTLNPTALIPIDFKPDPTEIEPPLVPYNYGLLFDVNTLKGRDLVRKWYRGVYDDNDVVMVESQIDCCPHLFGAAFFPFAPFEGALLSNKMSQHAFIDDCVEGVAHESVSKARDLMKACLSAQFHYDMELDYERFPLGSDDAYARHLFKAYHKMWKEFGESFSRDGVRRLCKIWSEAAVGICENGQAKSDPDFFGHFVDEYHFLRLRSFDALGPACMSMVEMGTVFRLSSDQADDPIIKEYIHVFGELCTLANDLCSFEKEFRAGVQFHLLAFLKYHFGLDWRDALQKLHMMYFQVVDKLEDLLAAIYASEWGKNAELMMFLEQAKFGHGSCMMAQQWMLRYNVRYAKERYYHWMSERLGDDHVRQYANVETELRQYNQTFTAFWANVSDPFEAMEKIATKEGATQHFDKCSWDTQEFSEELWQFKEGRVALSGPFAGYDPRSNDNTFPAMVKRFRQHYKWQSVKQMTWQQQCLRKYCEKKFGSADWLDNWKRKWMSKHFSGAHKKF